MEQREKLGLSSSPKGKLSLRQYPTEPASALEKVEVCLLITTLCAIDSLSIISPYTYSLPFLTD